MQPTPPPGPGLVTCFPPFYPDTIRPEPIRPQTTLQKVEGMVSDKLSQALAHEHGLNIQNVSWEDNARDKESCWGPCISDMTLQVKDDQGEFHCMPVIRQPNFSDKTSDVDIDKFTVLVGNEKGGELVRIPLSVYLQELTSFLNNGHVKGSLLAARDAKVIHSVQACFLPAEAGKEVNFNVGLFNYQSWKGHPAVLTIVSSPNGTSVEIIDEANGWNGQKLGFNKNGKACDFAAERLKDVRAAAGVATEGAMSAQELNNNKLLIIQIPLKHEKKPPTRMYAMGGYPESVCMAACSMAPQVLAKSVPADMDYGQIKVGKETGEAYHGLGGLTIERDESFPIRVTTQLYRLTNDGCLNREQMETLAKEIKAEEKIGQNASSLVLENTNRITESNVKAPAQPMYV